MNVIVVFLRLDCWRFVFFDVIFGFRMVLECVCIFIWVCSLVSNLLFIKLKNYLIICNIFDRYFNKDNLC